LEPPLRFSGTPADDFQLQHGTIMNRGTAAAQARWPT